MILLIRWLLRKRRERQGDTPGHTSTTAASHGPLALVLHQARYDLLGILRNRQARFFTLVLPILFLVIFCSAFGNGTVHHQKLSTTYVPGLSALAVIASSFVNLVISITAQRETGVLKRRRATPVSAWILIAGRTLTALGMSLFVVAVLLAVGRILYGVTLPTSTIPGVVLTTVIGSITFCVLGYALSTAISNQDSAQPMVQAIMLPLYFISGVFVASNQLPSWLRHVADVFPVEHLSDGLHHDYLPGAHGVGIVWSDIGVLALWAAIGLGIALARFSWLPKAAST